MSSVFLKDAKMFSKAVVSIYPPTSRHECYHCSMFSPALGIAIILNFHECEGCETVSHYCYNLHSQMLMRLSTFSCTYYRSSFLSCDLPVHLLDTYFIALIIFLIDL